MTGPLFRTLLNLFFPRACAVCGENVPSKNAFPLCGPCWDAVPRSMGSICDVCGVPLSDAGPLCGACRSVSRRFDRCRSVGIYDGVLKECLLKLKYHAKDY